MFTVRAARLHDKQKILALYKKVALKTGGLARSEAEISDDYIQHFMDESAKTGIELVVVHPFNQDEIIAEMHGYKMIPKFFAHVISELTIAVDPDFHGRGVGHLLFTHFLEHITNHRPDILRVELVTQESNSKAIQLYKRIGFETEGRFENRIRNRDNKLEADIPLFWINKNFIDPHPTI